VLGKRLPQANLLAADTQYLKFVGEDSFYGFLAREGRKLFRDEEFAALYCLDNGRTSVPPSLLATALLLQTHDRVSDEEAKRGRTSICAGRWRWGSRLTAVPSPRARCRCFGRSW